MMFQQYAQFHAFHIFQLKSFLVAFHEKLHETHMHTFWKIIFAEHIDSLFFFRLFHSLLLMLLLFPFLFLKSFKSQKKKIKKIAESNWSAFCPHTGK